MCSGSFRRRTLGHKLNYVLNQGCDVVTVFDAATQLPMRYITVGNNPSVSESPHMIRISPDGKYWYVVFVANNILQKYSYGKLRSSYVMNKVLMMKRKRWNYSGLLFNEKKKTFDRWIGNFITI